MIQAIKKAYPILDEKGRPCTFPTFASQVYMEDGTSVESAIQNINLNNDSNSNDVVVDNCKMPVGGLAGQILAKTSDEDFDVQWIDAPTGGEESTLMDLLWENPNPLANFPATTIAIENASNYTHFVITGIMHGTKYPTHEISTMCEYGHGTILSYHWGDTSKGGHRRIEFANDSFDIKGAAYDNGTDHSSCIPYKIYGLDINASLPAVASGNASNLTVDDIYPVGSIYMSVDSTSPASRFANTTWEQLKDRFLIGAGGSYSNGATGGAATTTIAEKNLPWNTTVLSQYGSKLGNYSRSDSNSSSAWGFSALSDVYKNASGGVYVDGTNYNVTMNTMPPYLGVYMWKRVS